MRRWGARLGFLIKFRRFYLTVPRLSRSGGMVISKLCLVQAEGFREAAFHHALQMYKPLRPIRGVVSSYWEASQTDECFNHYKHPRREEQ